MNRLIFPCLALCCAAVALRAGPQEEAIIAMMRLAEQPNYSWIATVTDDARTYEIAGRTIRGGFTRVKMPLITAVRRKLGRSATDAQAELIFHGNVACVILTERGWMRPEDLPEPAPDDPDFGQPPSTRPRAGAIGSPTIPIGPGGKSKRPERPATYSNLQLALSHPHEDLAVIVSGHTKLRREDGHVSGTLTDTAARLLLVRDGQDGITPLRAEGTFRVWLDGGMATKFQVQLQGVLSVKTRAGPREITVQQSTVTQIRQVGATAFEVPDEARIKLAP